jgi:RNA-directed DNA polymerase
VQTSLWSFLTRESGKPAKEEKQMTTENSVGAASDTKVNQPTIDWRQVHRNVRRLQMRIVKATQNCGEAASQEGRWKGLSGIWRKS